jgi:hypothetical protein
MAAREKFLEKLPHQALPNPQLIKQKEQIIVLSLQLLKIVILS